MVMVRKLLEGDNMAFLKGLITSKKLGAVIAGILTVLLKNLLDLDDATVAKIVELIMAYILGQSTVDFALAFKGNKRA